MKPRLKEVDAVSADEVDETVFAREPPGPSARQMMLKRLRLAEARERITQHRLDEFESPQRYVAVLLDPVSQVFAKLRMKNRVALAGCWLRRLIFSCQGRVPAAA